MTTKTRKTKTLTRATVWGITFWLVLFGVALLLQLTIRVQPGAGILFSLLLAVLIALGYAHGYRSARTHHLDEKRGAHARA